MSTRLYKRGCKVTLITPKRLPNAFFDREPGSQNAIEITDMRVRFEIERHVKSDPNRCEVIITNLAERTRSLCEKKPLQVWIDAGYDGVLYQLFTGDLRLGFSKLEKPEWHTHMQLGDGDRALRLARVNRSYASGTPIMTAVRDTAASMGLTLNPAEASKLASLQIQFLAPKAVQGSSRDELTRLLSPYGITWSIQNGRLQLLRDTDALQGQTVLVSQDTGLIGSPSFTTPTQGSSLKGKPSQVRFKMLLYPLLTPGQLVEVHSRDIAGRTFRVERLTHRGDTHGDEWFTEVEASPAQPGTSTKPSVESPTAPDHPFTDHVKEFGQQLTKKFSGKKT